MARASKTVEAKKRQPIRWRLWAWGAIGAVACVSTAMGALRVRQFALSDPQFRLLHDKPDALSITGLKYASKSKVQRVFAGELRSSVDAERVGRVLLGVRRALFPIEDEIRGIVNERRTRGARDFTQVCDGVAVDAIGALAIGFRAVHVGVGGGIDDHLRLCCGDRGRDSAIITDIDLVYVHGSHVETAKGVA